jgi:hypothetical protein
VVGTGIEWWLHPAQQTGFEGQIQYGMPGTSGAIDAVAVKWGRFVSARLMAQLREICGSVWWTPVCK